MYTSFSDNKYVVVRKGYEHPEIIMKIVSVLFDYSRFEDKENADEINSYFGLNVDPTARPLVINVDYNESNIQCHKGYSSCNCRNTEGKQFKRIGKILLQCMHKIFKRRGCNSRGLGCI